MHELFRTGLAAVAVAAGPLAAKGSALKQFQIIPLYRHEHIQRPPLRANYNPKQPYAGVSIRGKIRPTLTAFLPARRNNSHVAMIICPGGAYVYEAVSWEGYNIGNYFRRHGINCFVLRYRLPQGKAANKGHAPRPLLDVRQAIRLVRLHARQWHINPHKVGIMGFSAGGSLASLAGTDYRPGNPSAKNPLHRASSRPDFMALLYPVISMRMAITHKQSRGALIGPHPTRAAVRRYSSELNVSSKTPPAFIALARDDSIVPIQNSIRFYNALRKAGVPAQLHIFPTGNHGFGIGHQGQANAQWPRLFLQFLRQRKILRPRATQRAH